MQAAPKGIGIRLSSLGVPVKEDGVLHFTCQSESHVNPRWRA